MSVFVVDRHKKPLMPCSEKRARLLLERGKVVVHRRYPFTIRLKERVGGAVQPVRLKGDPGAQTTGVALVREAGDGQHVLHLAEIAHRGATIRQRLRRRAACVGAVPALHGWNTRVLCIDCMGRGSYQRTRLTEAGFPRGYLLRQKRVRGFQTGDMAKAVVSSGKKEGEYGGRVAIRATGRFNIQTATGVVQGISWKCCVILSRADGHAYSTKGRGATAEHAPPARPLRGVSASSPRLRPGSPAEVSDDYR